MPKTQKKSPLYGEEYSALEDLEKGYVGEDGVPMLSLKTPGLKNPARIYSQTTIKMKKVTIKDKIRKIMPYFLLLQFMLFLYLLFVYFNYQGILPMFFKNETEPTTPYTTPYYSYNTTTTSTTSLNNTRGSNPLLILKENEGDTVSYGTSNEVSGPYEDLEEVTDPIKDLMPTTSKQEEVSESGSGEVEEVTDSIKIPITMPTTETTKPTSAIIFTEFNTTDMTSSTEKQENSLNALDVEFENTFTISQQNISNIVLN
jgi:hypothetical protein